MKAIRGEDAVDLPANYKGLISSESKITEGTILGQKASFTLEFMGINTLKDGTFIPIELLQLLSTGKFIFSEFSF